MEWGSAGGRGTNVRVSYCYFPDEIVFKVQDEGPGFDPDSVPDPTIDPIGHIARRAREGKRSGGYGLYIVRKLMDRVIYSEKGNAVLFSKRIER